MAEQEYSPELAKQRYEELKTFRDPYLTRAESYSKVTLPYIMPDVDDRTSTEVQLDFSSYGATLTNHLANRYVQELFPVNKSFFQLQIDETEREGDDESSGEISTLLTAGERRARWAFEQRNARPVMLDIMKHCIVTGNGLVYYPPEGAVQMYALDEYVLYRDASGKVLEIVTRDVKGLMSLDADMRQQVIDTMDLGADVDLTKQKADLFTYIRINPENPEEFLVNQSIEGVEVPDSAANYPADLLPWWPQVWNRTRKEIYGRGLVEDHYGSFSALSVLSEALVTGAAAMSDIKYLIRPGSMLDVNAMNSAASGTYHYGMPDDVSSVKLDKHSDYAFIQAVIAEYKKVLGQAFLSISSQIRDSERTTAEENRLRAMELDQSHGGVFSTFGTNLQQPTARLLLRDIDLDIEGSSIEPTIVTGLDAMSRNATNEKIRLWLDDLAMLNGVPEEVRARMSISDLSAILANGRDVDSTKIVKSEQDFQAEQAALQNQNMQNVAGEELLKKSDAGAIAQGVQASGG